MSSQHHSADKSAKIAIVGLANQYPDADTPKGFWNNLLDKKDSRTRLRPEKLGANPNAYQANKVNQTVFTVIKAATLKTSPLTRMAIVYPLIISMV
nr:beta-ketoacyl synthase N-terminal-like domain-containing protein [Photobacterium sanguinicancri]